LPSTGSKLAITRIAQAGHDIPDIVQPFVDRGQVDRVRVLGTPLDASGANDTGDDALCPTS
jgi:hypothetical protein